MITRKEFLRLSAATAAWIAGNAAMPRRVMAALFEPKNVPPREKSGLKGAHDLVVCRGELPYQMTIKAVEAMGGMGNFVRPGSVVLIKPNMAWDRSPEQAANTNPEVVAALIDLCLEAGAKRVNVFDRACNEERRCYQNSGIEAMAKQHGAHVFFPGKWDVVKMDLPYESPMQGWPVFREAIACDTFINVPIVKHHGLTGLTLSMKNLMGVCGDNRGKMHVDIGRKLVDLTDFINPDLTVLDAYRVLTNHGPQGGDLADVKKLGVVVCATDPLLADTYACKLMKRSPDEIPYVQHARERGFGSSDLEQARIMQVIA